MTNLLTSIFKRNKPAAAAEVERALQSIDIASAESALRELEDKREASLLTAEPSELVEAQKQIDEARLRLEQMLAQRAALEARRDALKAEAVEAERRRTYDAAKAALESGNEIFAAYESAAREVVKSLAAIAAVDRQIIAANSALPAGANPLASMEQRWRCLPGEEPRVLGVDTIRTTWVYTGAHAGWGEVEEGLIGEIEKTSPNRGTINRKGFNSVRHVERVLLKSRRVRDSVAGYEPEPLAQAIRLPAVPPGCPDLWQGEGYNGGGWIPFAELTANVEELARNILLSKSIARDPRPEPYTRAEKFYEPLPNNTDSEVEAV